MSIESRQAYLEEFRRMQLGHVTFRAYPPSRTTIETTFGSFFHTHAAVFREMPCYLDKCKIVCQFNQWDGRYIISHDGSSRVLVLEESVTLTQQEWLYNVEEQIIAWAKLIHYELQVEEEIDESLDRARSRCPAPALGNLGGGGGPGVDSRLFPQGDD